MLGLQEINFKINNSIIDIKLGEISTITNNNRVREIEKEKMQQYLLKFFSIIDNWQPEYIDRQFIDGNDWTLTLLYDHSTKEYKGHGSSPNNFNLLETLLDLMMEGRD